MSKSPNLTTKNVIVPANGSVNVSATGRQVKCLTSTGAVGAVLMRMANGGTTRFDVLDKYILPEDQKFTEFTLENTTGVAVTMKVYIGDGDIQTGGDVTISGTVTTKENAPNATGTIADVTLNAAAATQILPALAGRVSAVIVSDPANTFNCRVGDSANVAVGRGAMVQPGQPYTHVGEGELWGFATPAGQKFSVTYITRT